MHSAHHVVARRTELCLWLLIVVCGLGACGYVREPAKGPAADLPSPPKPAWPSNYTGLRASRLDLPIKLAGDKPGDPSWTLTMVGEPVGQGWISWNGNISTPDSRNDAFQFAYSAWRSEPTELLTLVNPMERLDALERKGDFGMRFSLWMPIARNPKGIVIHQWGLGGDKYERRIVDTLRAGGWAVLAYDGFKWEPPRQWMTPDASWAVDGATGPGAAARRIAAEKAAAVLARTTDDVVGQYVLGVEAALTHVRRRFPSVADSPLAVIGCSLGSLMTPALVTRLGGQVDACVLVGSGVNLAQLSGKAWWNAAYSFVRTGGTRLLAVPAAERERLFETYLEHATLDPYHAAAALRTVPTLMLHARWDAIVPASGGDVLWERAGRPERWSGNFGHLWMFLTLDGMADDIVAWIDSTVAAERADASSDP